MYAEKKPTHHAGSIALLPDGLGVLKTAGIYGANASGKTNMLLAFQALQRLICDSGDFKDGDKITLYQPYLLCETTKIAPTKFEVEFYCEGQRFRYQLEFNNERILFEKLDFFPKSRAANLFMRTIEDIKFGEHYKGGRKKIAYFNNNAYLSKAGNTADAPQAVKDIFNKFRNNMGVMLDSVSATPYELTNQNSMRSIINTALDKVDLGIESFDIENNKKEIFYHSSANGQKVKFNKDMESMGTIKFFQFMPLVAYALEHGTIFLVDELESSLHPHIAELIIKLFNDPQVNKNNAQLIFTTHNLSLMSSQTMRKDQIYLTEKSVEGGTELSNLEDFDSVLKDSSPFAKWYDEGRLGAIPAINYREIADAIIEAM